MAEQVIELLPVLEQIEREKGIKKADLLKTIEVALVSAYRKHAGNKNLNLEVHLDESTGEIKAYNIKKVVETLTNPDIEISLEEALKLKPKVKVDTDLKFEVSINEFGRIAAQTAKQVIIQKIREVEKDLIIKTLEQTGGNRTKAAEILGITRKTLQNKLKEYELE